MSAAFKDLPHIPVLKDAAIAALKPEAGGVFVDGTFGGGGYTQSILEAAACRVIALDRDPMAIAAGRSLVKQYPERLRLINGRFGDLCTLINEAGVPALDGFVLDLGVSSMQLDAGVRGFSFMRDGPLDMRMGGASEGRTVSAADVVNEAPEDLLVRILKKYGEERQAQRIAHALIVARRMKPITRTGQLAEIVQAVLGRPRDGKIHPATRTFQALRIYVNDELGELMRALYAAEKKLKPGGRLVVVAFHSLEDRIVKRFMAHRADPSPAGSRHLPAAPEGPAPSFKLAFKGAKAAGPDEIAQNPRARSARLRAAVRTEAPALPLDWSALGLDEEEME